jgi:Tol biopolymer transport system component
MEVIYRSRRGVAVFFCFLTLFTTAAPLQPIDLIQPGQNPPASGAGESGAPITSPDGRYVLFASTANNLVTIGTNPVPALIPRKLNVFLRDRVASTTTLISVNSAGSGGGNGDSIPFGVSTNGRFALFESAASDLVPGDTNNATDIFVRDLVLGATTLVSVATNGSVANANSRTPAMTPDGRYVAFVSDAYNLVAGDTNSIPDVFVRDLQSGVTTLVSVGATYTSTTRSVARSEAPIITPDGHYVTFLSVGTNYLISGAQNAADIVVRDMFSETTTWASSAAREAVLNVSGATIVVAFNHAISTDGQFVAYEAASASSLAGAIVRYELATGISRLVHTNAVVPVGPYENLRSLDLTPDGRFLAFVARTNGPSAPAMCVLVWDAQNAAVTLASGGLSGEISDGAICDWPILSANGQSVAFLSTADGLVTNQLSGDYHLYVRDLSAAATKLVDLDLAGSGSGVSPMSAPQFSADGRFVTFECPDAELVVGDSNHAFDVFTHDLVGATVELISARAPSLPSFAPNGPSTIAAFSVNHTGDRVAFSSDASDLVPGDSNGYRDVFVRDAAAGTTILASIGTNGVASDGPSLEASISSDGRYVIFTSSADNLVVGDTNNASDIFVRDLQANSTVLVSVGASGVGPGNRASYSPVASANGRRVLFRSKAGNLGPGILSGGTENLFLRDLDLSKTYTVTTNGLSSASAVLTPDGQFVSHGSAVVGRAISVWSFVGARQVYGQGNLTPSVIGISPDGTRLGYFESSINGPLTVVELASNTKTIIANYKAASRPTLKFSSDGRFLTYAAAVTNIDHVFLYDFVAGINLQISRTFLGSLSPNGNSRSPEISADGQFVAYCSDATNIVPGDDNRAQDIFVYHRLTGTTTRPTSSWLADRAPDQLSLNPVFSGDGRILAFESWASDLIPQDLDASSGIFAVALYPVFSASLTAGTVPGQPPTISWPVLPGKTYRLLYKDSLADQAWQELLGTPTLNGDRLQLKDPAPASRRFYRIIAY